MAGAVEVQFLSVERTGLAVADVPPSVRQRLHQAPDFAGERMMLAVAGLIDPEDLLRRG